MGITMGATYIVAGRRLVRTLCRRISHLFALTYNQASSNKFHLGKWYYVLRFYSGDQGS